jgi:signal transduction histidine kinase
MAAELDSSAASVADLVRDFDNLCRAERQAVLTRVASSLAHALGTPLNVIAGRAALASMSGISPQEVSENCQIITRQVKTITTMLHEVLRFAREGGPAPQPSDLDELARRAVRLLEPLASSRGIEIRVEATERLQLGLHTGPVVHVLAELLSFGLAASPSPRAIRVTPARAHAEPPQAERGRVPAGEYARVSILFEGSSVDARLLSNVYEPWLHPADLERSPALSLAIAFGVAREHRGWVEHRASAEGSALLLHWPIAPSTPAA